MCERFVLFVQNEEDARSDAKPAEGSEEARSMMGGRWKAEMEIPFVEVTWGIQGRGQ
jgi:hypothetical protein